jgi:hypothetical protein
MKYSECEKCKKILKAKKEIINNWVVFVVSIFILLIVDGLAPHFYYGVFIFYGLVIFFCFWCWRFIKRNRNVYIKVNNSDSVNKTVKEGEKEYG